MIVDNKEINDFNLAIFLPLAQQTFTSKLTSLMSIFIFF